MSMGTLHRSIAVSGAIAAAGAAMIDGTVAFKLRHMATTEGEFMRLGHPGGTIDVSAKIEKRGDAPFYVEATIGRTARRLMEGYVLVPEKHYK
jgi:2-methylaconitate cis-trans-isomerase PrpF